VAYFNRLASASESDVERLRSDPLFLVQPSLVLGASHLLGYWVKVQPLGGLLGQALDGGQPLHPKLWHPLRAPGYHPPAIVAELADSIGQAWEETIAGEPLPDGDWLAVEVVRLLRVFQHAAGAGECIISALDAPADHERASRVHIPWVPRWDAASGAVK
jgi:hypothetical protein